MKRQIIGVIEPSIYEAIAHIAIVLSKQLYCSASSNPNKRDIDHTALIDIVFGQSGKRTLYISDNVVYQVIDLIFHNDIMSELTQFTEDFHTRYCQLAN